MFLKLEYMSAIVDDCHSCLYIFFSGGGGSSQQFVVCNASKTTLVRNAYFRVNLSQSEM